MSDTPKTDAQELIVPSEIDTEAHRYNGQYVIADFARSLERENAELKSMLKFLGDAVDKLEELTQSSRAIEKRLRADDEETIAELRKQLEQAKKEIGRLTDVLIGKLASPSEQEGPE